MKKKICCICDIAVFFLCHMVREEISGNSAAKQSTVQCSNLFVAAPKRKQKMRKKSMLAMLQIEKNYFGITCLSRNMFLTQFVWCFDFLADLK